LQHTQLINCSELTSLLDTLHEGVQAFDRQWHYTYVNQTALVQCRKNLDELLGLPLLECFPGFERTEAYAMLQRCMERRIPGSLRSQFTYASGETVIFEVRARPSDVGISVLTLDVTETHQLETQLRHAQKLEAVGRLAGGIAHDFNNMLSVILSYAGLLLEDLPPAHGMREDIECIQGAGERAASLTRRLLAFSRQQVMTPKVVDLNQLVQGAEQLFSPLLGADVEVVTGYDSLLPQVKVDPGQIDQVVMNLVVNARDAMPQGGKLFIETKHCVLQDDYAAKHVGVVPGRYALLCIGDTGSGMDAETQTRIFEPFFTTKEAGKGTGLGLSTVFDIVQQSQGHIRMYSEPGQGTTFRIYFPEAEAAQSAEPSRPQQSCSYAGSETVLVVEDQADVRQVAARILRRYGYHVLEASNAGEALLVCERHPEAIDLLLSDVVMPKMTGGELAQRLLRRRPDMQVLYMSGHDDGVIAYHGILDADVAYLQKPIVPEPLVRSVRQALDSRDKQSGVHRTTRAQPIEVDSASARTASGGSS
jgi:signal transduction histidine kinase/FixJ family two-component response regulator